MSLIKGLTDLQDRLKSLEQHAEEDALRAALNGAALVKSRVQQFGEDAGGSAFESYSPDYAKARSKAGYQIGQVDFTRTGKMWASWGPVLISVQNGIVTVHLIPSNDQDRKKMEGQFKKRGNIGALNDEEIRIVQQDYAEAQIARLG